MALSKAVIINRDAKVPAPIPVMFNPPGYALAKTNQFAEIRIPGLPSAILQYVSGEATTLTTELFFDTTSSGTDVRTRTAAITNLTEPDAITQAPPRLLLLWGSLAFQCVLVSVRQEFEAFNSLGTPQRARLQVELKGWDELTALVARTSLPFVDEPGAYIVKAGQTLAQIAAEQYQNAGAWRQIAEANGLDDPRTLTAGMKLRIPRLS